MSFGEAFANMGDPVAQFAIGPLQRKQPLGDEPKPRLFRNVRAQAHRAFKRIVRDPLAGER